MLSDLLVGFTTLNLNERERDENCSKDGLISTSMNYENGDVINPFEVFKEESKGKCTENKNHYHSHNNIIFG